MGMIRRLTGPSKVLLTSAVSDTVDNTVGQLRRMRGKIYKVLRRAYLTALSHRLAHLVVFIMVLIIGWCRDGPRDMFSCSVGERSAPLP